MRNGTFAEVKKEKECERMNEEYKMQKPQLSYRGHWEKGGKSAWMLLASGVP